MLQAIIIALGTALVSSSVSGSTTTLSEGDQILEDCPEQRSHRRLGCLGGLVGSAEKRKTIAIAEKTFKQSCKHQTRLHKLPKNEPFANLIEKLQEVIIYDRSEVDVLSKKTYPSEMWIKAHTRFQKWQEAQSTIDKAWANLPKGKVTPTLGEDLSFKYDKGLEYLNNYWIIDHITMRKHLEEFLPESPVFVKSGGSRYPRDSRRSSKASTTRSSGGSRSDDQEGSNYVMWIGVGLFIFVCAAAAVALRFGSKPEEESELGPNNV